MADFEGLIRQALARQDAEDPAIRQKVYQSSRNALARMIASAAAQPPDLINKHREALENSIRRIEAGYAGSSVPTAPDLSAPQPQAAPPPVPSPPSDPVEPPSPVEPDEIAAQPPAPQFDAPQARTEPQAPSAELPGQQTGHLPDFAAEPAIADEGDTPSIAPDDMPRYPTRRRRTGRIIAIVAFLGLLGLVGWLLFTLAGTIALDEPPTNTAGSQSSEPGLSQDGGDPADSDYITVLSPVSTGTLVTAGRGRAEIVNQSNMDYVRLTSLRTDPAREATAEPILLSLEPGVIEQISGRRVTVEILAKSGGTGPANFAVGCRIGDQDVCGRKRFRIGLQPEATVFTMNVPGGIRQNEDAYLTINTDVSATAIQSGEGAAVDILYARLRLPDE